VGKIESERTVPIAGDTRRLFGFVAASLLGMMTDQKGFVVVERLTKQLPAPVRYRCRRPLDHTWLRDRKSPSALCRNRLLQLAIAHDAETGPQFAQAMTRYHPISTKALCTVIALMTACQPAILRPATNQQQPPAPVHPTPPPAAVAAPALPQLPPVGAGPPAVEELFTGRVQPKFSIDPLGTSAALRDGEKILAIVAGDRVEPVDIPDPSPVVVKAYPSYADPEAEPIWDVDHYFGQWPDGIWAIAKNAFEACALVRWSSGSWRPVFSHSDIIWAGLTANGHALVFLSFYRQCYADDLSPSMPNCPHGVQGFRAFDADGKPATGAPVLPSVLAPGAWKVRPEVAALPNGEVILSRLSGPELPRKSQHLVVHWTQPQARGTVQWLGDPHEDFRGSLTVQSTGAIHVVSDTNYGYRREGTSWKQWKEPPGSLNIFADQTLWSVTREGELLCSRDGDEWQEVWLGLPTAERPATIRHLWRGTATTLYVVADIGSASHVFRVRNVTQCLK